MTARQLDRTVASLANCDERNAAAHDAWTGRGLECRHNDNGSSRITLLVPTDVALEPMAVVAARCDELIAERTAADDEDPPSGAGGVSTISAIRADAAVDLMSGAAAPLRVELLVETPLDLVEPADPNRASGDRPTVRRSARIERTPIADVAAERRRCESVLRALVTNVDGSILDVGRCPRRSGLGLDG